MHSSTADVNELFDLWLVDKVVLGAGEQGDYSGDGYIPNDGVEGGQGDNPNYGAGHFTTQRGTGRSIGHTPYAQPTSNHLLGGHLCNTLTVMGQM